MKKYNDIEIDENNVFQNDLLNREEEIKNLTQIILNFDSSLVLALNSPWGSGKTTFVRLWLAYLKNQGKKSIFFNAWETDYAEDPLIVLVNELNKWLKNNGDETVADEVLKKSKKVLFSIAKQTAIAAVKAVTLNAVDGEQFDRIASDATGSVTGDLIESFNKQSEAINIFKEEIIPKIIAALPSDQKNLPIFIDELDRCRPTYAIELLERIKHLFNTSKIVFVLSMDTSQLAHSFCAVYGHKFDANKYLKRFIDLDYTIKKPEIQKYIIAQIRSIQISDEFSNRKDFQFYNEEEQLKNCLTLFSNRFSLNLRDINTLLARILLILYSIKHNQYLDMPLLIALLLLRDQNKDLYDQYINSPNIADKVIDFLLQDIPQQTRDTRNCAEIIGLLIACCRNNYNANGDFERLLTPYREQIVNAINTSKRTNQIIIDTAESPREMWSRDGEALLKLTLDRIELVNQIKVR